MNFSISEFGHIHCCKLGVQLNNNRMANSVDPDEMACHELSHLDLHCLHRYLFRSAGLKGLRDPCTIVLFPDIPYLT